VRLAPSDARLATVHAVALHDLGRKPQAIQALESALRESPNDRDLLFVLASYLQEAGQRERALRSARRLVELEPEDPRARELLSGLEASPAAAGGGGPS
jgi:Flp pilus assembly protein TadD